MGRNLPLESAKNRRGLHLPTQSLDPRRFTRPHRAISKPNVKDKIGVIQSMVEHRQRDEAREPEQHGERVEGEDGEDVGDRGEKAWGEAEVDEDEHGPGGDKDHEVDLGDRETDRCD